MTVWSWLRLTACLWLVRKAVKATGWLLAFVTVIAARPPLRTTWPLTPCRQNSSGRFRQISTLIGSGCRFAVTAQS